MLAIFRFLKRGGRSDSGATKRRSRAHGHRGYNCRRLCLEPLEGRDMLSIVPTIVTLPATAVGSAAASLNAQISSTGGAAITQERFSWGSTPSCSDGYTSAVTANGNSFSYTLTGLTPSHSYYFQAWADNTAGWGKGSAVSFTTTIAVKAPAVATVAATPVGSASATLNAQISSTGGAAITQERFSWGSTPSCSDGYTSAIMGNGNNFSYTLTGLTPSHTYYFQAWADNSAGWGIGSALSFTTTSAVKAPAVATAAASSVTANSAVMNGTVNPNGASTSAYFQYGTTTSYGSTAQSITGITTTQNLQTTVTGLAPSTIYHYRIVASNSGGTSYGSDMSFTATIAVKPPAVATAAASSVFGASAAMNGVVNPNGATTSAYFQYGTTTSYGSTGQLTTRITTTQNLQTTVTGLAPSTIYHYRIVASNSGGTSYGSDMSFTTAKVQAATITLDASTQPDSQSRFWVSTACVMPKITVKLANLPANTPANLVVAWTVVVDLPAGASPKGVHLRNSFTTNAGTTYTPNFPSLMGGNLTISAACSVNGVNYTLSTASNPTTAQLKILGTNPTKAQIQALINSQPVPQYWPSGSGYDYHSILRKIANFESGGYFQFYTSGPYQGYPVWSSDGLGGAGIMQITPASFADVWNWQTNILDGVAKFNTALKVAATYPTTIQTFPQFTTAVKAYNAARVAQGLPALKSVVVPLWSSDPTQGATDRVLDAIRCYNGAGGTDSIGVPILHEFQLATTSSGLLDLTVNSSTLVGTAKWVEVPVKDRHSGDPNYVQDVLGTLDT